MLGAPPPESAAYPFGAAPASGSQLKVVTPAAPATPFPAVIFTPRKLTPPVAFDTNTAMLESPGITPSFATNPTSPIATAPVTPVTSSA
jgi:hypothetical protein